MKLVCSKSNLLNAVNIVSKAVPSKTTMSILQCILINATTSEIKFTANDMELGIETKVEGEILEKGIEIIGNLLAGIIEKVPDLIGARSFSAFAIGARQFVVQEAAEITVSSGFRSLWFTL